jgi:hypothetical protein
VTDVTLWCDVLWCCIWVQVLQGRKTVRTLMELDDYSGALQVISATRQLFHKHLTGRRVAGHVITHREVYVSSDIFTCLFSLQYLVDLYLVHYMSM